MEEYDVPKKEDVVSAEVNSGEAVPVSPTPVESAVAVAEPTVASSEVPAAAPAEPVASSEAPASVESAVDAEAFEASVEGQEAQV